MKYVMFLTEVAGIKRKVPIIFPNSLVHLDVAKALTSVVGSSKICSAGEVNMIVLSTHGESTTIKIKSKREDIDVINGNDYHHGMEL